MQPLQILVMLVFIQSLESQCPNRKTDFLNVRKRRYLNFPDQTTMVLTMSLLKAFMTHAPSGWNLALEVDVIFPMPDANFTNAHFRRKLHHRQRREFWGQLQNAIDLHSVNGKACILRSVCEAKKYLAPPGKSLVHDLLRALFIAVFLLEKLNFFDDIIFIIDNHTIDLHCTMVTSTRRSEERTMRCWTLSYVLVLLSVHFPF